MLPDSLQTAALRKLGEEALAQLFDECPDLRTALLATMDGYPVASWGEPNTRIVVMAGTLQALARAFSKECRGEEVESLMMQAAAANLIVAPVPLPGGSNLVLALVADRELNLGMMRRNAVLCSQRITAAAKAHLAAQSGVLTHV